MMMLVDYAEIFLLSIAHILKGRMYFIAGIFKGLLAR